MGVFQGTAEFIENSIYSTNLGTIPGTGGGYQDVEITRNGAAIHNEVQCYYCCELLAPRNIHNVAAVFHTLLPLLLRLLYLLLVWEHCSCCIIGLIAHDSGRIVEIDG